MDTDHFVEAHNGVVVSVSGPASDVGLSILKQGGNAVDAAIATAFALHVSYPLSGNIAGGGFMLVHPGPGKGEPIVIDYRECAPATATPTMYHERRIAIHAAMRRRPRNLRGSKWPATRFGTMTWANLSSRQ